MLLNKFSQNYLNNAFYFIILWPGKLTIDYHATCIATLSKKCQTIWSARVVYFNLERIHSL